MRTWRRTRKTMRTKSRCCSRKPPSARLAVWLRSTPTILQAHPRQTWQTRGHMMPKLHLSHLLMSSCVFFIDSMALWSSLRSAPFFLRRLLCLLLCPATEVCIFRAKYELKIPQVFNVEQPSSRSLPEESWWSGSGDEQPLSGLFGLSLLCFLFGTVTYTQTPTHRPTYFIWLCFQIMNILVHTHQALFSTQ